MEAMVREEEIIEVELESGVERKAAVATLCRAGTPFVVHHA